VYERVILANQIEVIFCGVLQQFLIIHQKQSMRYADIHLDHTWIQY